MEKMSMCRICLVENVRMYVVTNKCLQEMYEKLTNVPFVTEDSRPMLACYFCCSKLKQCCRLQRKCLEAEELLAQMLSEDYEHKPLTNLEHLEFVGEFVISPIENISIVEECQTERDAIKQELADVYEEPCDVELKVERLDEFESEDMNKSFLDVKAHHSTLQFEDKVVMEINLKAEDELPELKQIVFATERAPVTKIPKIYSRRPKVVTAKQKKNQLSDSKSLRTVENCASKSVTKHKEPETVHIASAAVENGAVDEMKETLNYQQNNDVNTNIHLNYLNNSNDINEHQSVGKKLFKCELCSREFTRKGDFKRHTCRQTGEKPFTCDICQRSFTHKQSLHYHFTTHTGKTPHKCILCERSFTNTESLKYHIRTHTGEKPHKCTECQRSFCTKTYLNNHIRTHTGEKPHKCDICQRSFRMKSHLINHIRAHTGEKPYKCDVCQLCFISSGYLTKHVRIHTGEKPFKCSICQRSFTHRTSLKYHISTHTGEKHND